MFEFMPQSSGNIIGIRATGKLTDADYRKFLIPRMEEAFAKHGKLNVLFAMDDDFEGWDLQAAWDDASYGLQHRADFDRLALVGGPKWVDWCIKLSGFLMKGEIRLFDADRLDKAWDWVRA